VHCAAPPVHLTWSVWGVDSRGFIMERGRLYGAAIPRSHVVVKVFNCVWYWVAEPAVVIVIVIICD
jgi:hypothetical protein